MPTFNTIELDQVCGGATRTQQVFNALNSQYGGGGAVVSLIGKPSFTRPHNGVEQVTGAFDESLGPADIKRSFTGSFTPSTGALGDLDMRLISMT